MCIRDRTKEVRTTSRQFIEQYVDNIGYKLSKFNTLLNSLSSNETIKQAFSEGAATDESCQEVDAAIRQILNNQFPYGLYDLTFYPLNKSIHGKSIFIRPLAEDTGSWKEKLTDRYFDHYFCLLYTSLFGKRSRTCPSAFPEGQPFSS